MAADYFEFFGLERKLNLDPGDLQRRFYRLSRELHPDRFARALPAERERAEQATAILNDAYRTLRDPIARAEYAVGRDAAERVDPELIEEVFEALESGDRGALAARLARVEAELDTLYKRYDAGEPVAAELRSALDRRRYLKKHV